MLILKLFLNKLPVAYHILGSQQIDEIWSTLNITSSALSIMPHYFTAGDHRSFIVDFPIEIFIGNRFIPIICYDMRRLTLS